MGSLCTFFIVVAAYFVGKGRGGLSLSRGGAGVQDNGWTGRRGVAALAVTAAFCAALLLQILNSSGRMLWLDDLYTLKLISAGSLPKLWQGIILGIDGNPPAYLTLAWLVTRPFSPQHWEQVLRCANLLLVCAGGLFLYRAAVRFVPWIWSLTGLLLFLSLSSDLRDAALGLRTYALFFCLAAASLLQVIRVSEARVRGNWFALSVVLATMVLIHTFGIVYDAGVVFGLLIVSQVRGDAELKRGVMFTAIVPVLIFLLWLPGIAAQGRTAQPYGWILPPSVLELLVPYGVVLAAGGLIVIALRNAPNFGRRAQDLVRQGDPGLSVALVVCGVWALIPVVIWMFSKIWIPLFVPRYMIPNVICNYVLLLMSLVLVGSEGNSRRLAGVFAVACAAISFPVLAFEPISGYQVIPCANLGHTKFLEDGFDLKGEPVIVESPHAWLPRVKYRRAVYIFPLDWDVVLKYPWMARNNAVDFHIMQNLQSWSGDAGILTTREILNRYARFYVLQEAGRSWFANFSMSAKDWGIAGHAKIVRESPECRLWHVTLDGRPD